jgi:DNA-directed RNA polymerase sigma subunit (sigma70/sigma32)
MKSYLLLVLMYSKVEILLDLDGTVEKTALKYSKDNHTYDSIQMYLKEIGQYPLISASEEKELARRIEKG